MPKRNPFEDVNANRQLPKRRRKRVMAKSTAPIDYAKDEEWALLNVPEETKVTKKAKVERRLSLADMKTPKMSNVTAQVAAAAKADTGSAASTSTTTVAAPQPSRTTTSRSSDSSSTGSTDSSSSQPEAPVKLTDSEKHRRRQRAWKRGVLETIMEESLTRDREELGLDDATTASSDHFIPRVINKMPAAPKAPDNKKPKAQQGGGGKKTVKTKIKPKPKPQTREEWFSEVSWGRSPTDMLSSYDPAVAYAAAQVIAARKANPPANDADSDSSPPENPELVRLMLQSCRSPDEDDEDDYPLDLRLVGSIVHVKKCPSVDGSELSFESFDSTTFDDDEDDRNQPLTRPVVATVPKATKAATRAPARAQKGEPTLVGGKKVTTKLAAQKDSLVSRKSPNQEPTPDKSKRKAANKGRRQKADNESPSLARSQIVSSPEPARAAQETHHTTIAVNAPAGRAKPEKEWVQEEEAKKQNKKTPTSRSHVPVPSNDPTSTVVQHKSPVQASTPISLVNERALKSSTETMSHGLTSTSKKKSRISLHNAHKTAPNLASLVAPADTVRVKEAVKAPKQAQVAPRTDSPTSSRRSAHSAPLLFESLVVPAVMVRIDETTEALEEAQLPSSTARPTRSRPRADPAPALPESLVAPAVTVRRRNTTEARKGPQGAPSADSPANSCPRLDPTPALPEALVDPAVTVRPGNTTEARKGPQGAPSADSPANSRPRVDPTPALPESLVAPAVTVQLEDTTESRKGSRGAQSTDSPSNSCPRLDPTPALRESLVGPAVTVQLEDTTEARKGSQGAPSTDSPSNSRPHVDPTPALRESLVAPAVTVRADETTEARKDPKVAPFTDSPSESPIVASGDRPSADETTTQSDELSTKVARVGHDICKASDPTLFMTPEQRLVEARAEPDKEATPGVWDSAAKTLAEEDLASSSAGTDPIESPESDVSNEEQDLPEWTTRQAMVDNVRNKKIVFALPNGVRYRHVPLPPGWNLDVSRTRSRPYYYHRDNGATFEAPVLLPPPDSPQSTDSPYYDPKRLLNRRASRMDPSPRSSEALSEQTSAYSRTSASHTSTESPSEAHSGRSVAASASRSSVTTPPTTGSFLAQRRQLTDTPAMTCASTSLQPIYTTHSANQSHSPASNAETTAATPGIDERSHNTLERGIVQELLSLSTSKVGGSPGSAGVESAGVLDDDGPVDESAVEPLSAGTTEKAGHHIEDTGGTLEERHDRPGSDDSEVDDAMEEEHVAALSARHETETPMRKDGVIQGDSKDDSTAKSSFSGDKSSTSARDVVVASEKMRSEAPSPVETNVQESPMMTDTGDDPMDLDEGEDDAMSVTSSPTPMLAARDDHSPIAMNDDDDDDEQPGSPMAADDEPMSVASSDKSDSARKAIDFDMEDSLSRVSTENADYNKAPRQISFRSRHSVDDESVSLLGDDGASQLHTAHHDVRSRLSHAWSRASYFSYLVLNPPHSICKLQNLEALPPLRVASKPKIRGIAQKVVPKTTTKERKREQTEKPKPTKVSTATKPGRKRRKSVIPRSLRR